MSDQYKKTFISFQILLGICNELDMLDLRYDRFVVKKKLLKDFYKMPEFIEFRINFNEMKSEDKHRFKKKYL